MIKKSDQREVKVLRQTLFVIVLFIVMAAWLNISSAEEVKPLEISSETVERVAKEPQKVSVLGSSNPLRLGVTPLFGILQSADGNQLLLNKYTAGFSAEVLLTSNISVEGVLRYAEYNIRPDILFADRTLSMVTTGIGGGRVPILNRMGVGILGDMRQFMVGGNLKYELFPEAIVTPYIGGGLVHFSNDYYTDSRKNSVKIIFPQSVYAANVMGGLKLKLSRVFSLLCRAEAGSLLNNRNGSVYYYDPEGKEASVHPFHSFRSYDKYMSGMVGVSFGL